MIICYLPNYFDIMYQNIQSPTMCKTLSDIMRYLITMIKLLGMSVVYRYPWIGFSKLFVPLTTKFDNFKFRDHETNADCHHSSSWPLIIIKLSVGFGWRKQHSLPLDRNILKLDLKSNKHRIALHNNNRHFTTIINFEIFIWDFSWAILSDNYICT